MNCGLELSPSHDQLRVSFTFVLQRSAMVFRRSATACANGVPTDCQQPPLQFSQCGTSSFPILLSASWKR